MNGVDRVLDYWYVNNLDKHGTIMLMINEFDSFGIIELREDLLELLYRVVDSNNYVTEDEARIIVNIFEHNIKDIDLLKKIACILSGENLENDYKVIESIMFKNHWSFNEDINVFICWFFRLCNNTKEYYKWIVKSFWYYKIIIFIKTLIIIFSVLLVVREITRLSIYIGGKLLNGIYDLYITFISTFNLFISFFLIVIATYKYDIILILQLNIRFKKFVV